MNKKLTNNQKILVYLVENNLKSTVTILMKLAYLIDLVSVNKNGNQIFDYKYRRYNYGPFDENIYSDLKCLCLLGILKTEFDYALAGYEYLTYSINKESTSFPIRIVRANKKIIDSVLESVKGLGAKTLTEMAYKTKPMKALGATLGGNENLNVKLDLLAN